MSHSPPLWKRFWLKLRGEDISAAAMRESLAEVVEQSERESPALSPQERVMLGNLLRFGELKVSDVMVPRAEIVAVDESIGLAELLKLFREVQHSRLPMFRETLDDPKGMVHIRDFLDFIAMRADGGASEAGSGDEAPLPSLGQIDLSMALSSANILRPVLFVPRSMPAIDLLVRMQATRTHMALVIDEYGGTDGLVSIEDLVEMVVGDIEDEHDEDATLTIVPAADGTYIADARASHPVREKA